MRSPNEAASADRSPAGADPAGSYRRGIGFAIALWKIQWVVEFMTAPLADVQERYPDVQVIQTKVFSAFTGSLKISFFAGLVAASPMILYQIWAFISAGLYDQERKVVKWYAIPGFGLFFLGVWVAYAIVMPYALEFLLSWANDLGIPLAWGGTGRLIHEIGAARAREVLMCCEDIPADKALAWGMLHEVVANDALDEAIDRWVEKITSKPEPNNSTPRKSTSSGSAPWWVSK